MEESEMSDILSELLDRLSSSLNDLGDLIFKKKISSGGTEHSRRATSAAPGWRNDDEDGDVGAGV
jgi:hypothetical protein